MNKQSSLRSILPPSLTDLQKTRKPLKNAHKESIKHLSRMNRLAIWITEHVGTMGFFFIIALWSVLWLGWNFLAPKTLVFDPPMGFVFWLFISNLIQILLMPLIMVGQNVQEHHNAMRAEHDLEINIKAEHEINAVLKHLEYQNALILKIINHLQIDIESIIHEK